MHARVWDRQSQTILMMLWILTPIFSHLLSASSGFHIPNLSLSADIDSSSNLKNYGLINSQIKQNWSQSLHIGSINIAAALLIRFSYLDIFSISRLLVCKICSKLLGKNSDPMFISHNQLMKPQLGQMCKTNISW